MLRQELTSDLSKLLDTGEAQAFGAAIDQTTGAKTMLTVPEGQVFLITHIVVQPETLQHGLSGATPSGAEIASPNQTVYGFDLNDATGTGQSVANFLTFRRWQQTFEFQDSPNWRNAAPSNVVTWPLRFPIPVPSTWTVSSTVGGEFGNHAAVYGYLVSEAGARTAGYKVSRSATDTDRMCGIASAAPTTSAATMVTARAGYSIRILDMYVRVQAQTNTTNKVTLQQEDGQKIFSWTSNNPTDMVDQAISPDIFLKPGQALQIVGTVAATASVCVVWEHVPEAEVPSDSWFAYIEPGFPSPGAPKTGLTSNIVSDSSPIILYYPRRATTKTSPTTGFQHIVRGYQVSIQKSTTFPPDQTLVTISEGTTGGAVQLSGTTTQTNRQITPVFAAVNHDQSVQVAVSGLNIPCRRDDGALWVDAMSLNQGQSELAILLLTPDGTDGDLDEWSMTLWGRTIPNKFTNMSNRGV
jgi:hypothetical protein